MVNVEKDSPKNHILTLLRESGKTISGQAIGETLGISRVAVHKHIKALRDEGYHLEAGSRGYRLLEGSRDPFTSWEFEPGEHVHVIKETVSTMDEAHRRAAAHPGEDFILAAEVQTGGRGRRDRSWSSPDGGLWLTRVIHPESSLLDTSRCTMAAAAAMAGLLRERYGINAEVKWPNDVLIDGRKAAGVLVEGRFSGDRIQYLAIGLGMNVNNETAEDRTGLKELLGREEDRRHLLRGWVEYSDAIFNSRRFRLRKKPGWWNSLMGGIGDEVEFRIRDGKPTDSMDASGRCVRGRILRADSLGRLVIEKENGRKVHLAAGDIEEKI